MVLICIVSMCTVCMHMVLTRRCLRYNIRTTLTHPVQYSPQLQSWHQWIVADTLPRHKPWIHQKPQKQLVQNTTVGSTTIKVYEWIFRGVSSLLLTICIASCQWPVRAKCFLWHWPGSKRELSVRISHVTC